MDLLPILAYASGTTDSLPLAAITMGLFGGLALFLFGLDLLAEALKLVAGDGMRKVLGKLTTNRFTGVLAGATVTAIIQSSSVTTVLLVGFISAGLMNLTQAIGVIMGANIGTTVTAQIIAFKVTKYALALVATGFLLRFVSKKDRVRDYGQVILGLGLIFFGMQLMSDGMRPLQSYAPFIDFMKNMDSPLIGILFGALFTGLVQSSSATTGIVIILASQGFLSLPAGIALIFGANIGTCVTAGLAALGKPREAKRAVLVHVLFNVAGVTLWFAFIPQLAELVAWISPVDGDLEGQARLAAESPRQIANAHAIFNIANTAIFIGLAGPMAWLVLKVIPHEKAKAEDLSTPQFINEILLETPSIALDMVRREIGRLGEGVLHVTRQSLPAVIQGSRMELDEIYKADSQIDDLHGTIIEYLGTLSQENLDDAQSDQLHSYLSAANHLESIGDMVETNLVEAGRHRSKAGLIISESTRDLLGEYHREVCTALDKAIRALVGQEPELAAEVIRAKPEVDLLTARAEEHLAKRLVADRPHRLVAFRLESEIVEYLKRIYYFSKRIAKLVDELEEHEHLEEVPSEGDGSS